MSTAKHKIAKTLMVQGCTSNAGKSLIVTALCRIAKNEGLSVAPFKPQNMANNSAVTIDGGEIGRAQALQAQACGIDPITDMNPVLLKPSGDKGSQVVVQGQVVANMSAREYMDYRPKAFEAVVESYNRLIEQYDLVLVEGAGSPAEINLRQYDIANMGFAEAVDCPVWLIGNIDHGGVFAHLYGTLALLTNSEQKRITHLMINGFRGDKSLLDPAIKWLEEKTRKPLAGVIPMIPNLMLDAEDSLSINKNTCIGTFNIAVLIAGRIANHTDFDPLASHPQVNLIWVQPGDQVPECDLLILPGSKTTINDLNALYEFGWHKAINSHLKMGKKLIGICGGYQMLGKDINDPLHLEGDGTTLRGLGLVPISTTLTSRKKLHLVEGSLNQFNVPFSGYEIHMGISEHHEKSTSFCQSSDGRSDGIISADNQIIGTYIHGIFDHPQSLKVLLEWAGLKNVLHHDFREQREKQIELIARVVKDHLNDSASTRLFDNSQLGR